MPSSHDRERRVLQWLALGLVIASAVVLWPFAGWVLLATWTAVFGRRVHQPLCRFLGGRAKIAALLTMTMLVLLAVPVFVLLTSLVVDAIELVQRLMSSSRVKELLRQLVSNEDGESGTSSMGLVMSQGGRAWALGQQIAGTAARMVIGLVILLAGAYTMLVDGKRWYAWVEEHAPISAETLRRLADAFVETGRGLMVGLLGAGFVQALVATILYVAIGVPQPYALGFLTLVFSVVPAVGTAVVWLPVAAGLALTGRPGAAAVLAIAGVALIGTIDNLVRPYLARRGHLQLPTYVVLIAMFGGLAVLGAWGILIAPLVIRLAKESLEILREQRG